MILVTVGTTMPFDSLIEEIDRLREKGMVKEDVLCQIGNGTYEPNYCEFVRFLPHLDQQIDEASLVIGHGGTGTTLDLLAKGKSFVSVANPMAVDAHQEIFLRRLAKDIELVWTSNVFELAELIEKAQALSERKNSLPHLSEHLKEYLNLSL